MSPRAVTIPVCWLRSPPGSRAVQPDAGSSSPRSWLSLASRSTTESYIFRLPIRRGGATGIDARALAGHHLAAAGGGRQPGPPAAPGPPVADAALAAAAGHRPGRRGRGADLAEGNRPLALRRHLRGRPGVLLPVRPSPARTVLDSLRRGAGRRARGNQPHARWVRIDAAWGRIRVAGLLAAANHEHRHVIVNTAR